MACFTLVPVPKKQKFLGCNRGILHVTRVVFQAHVPSRILVSVFTRRGWKCPRVHEIRRTHKISRKICLLPKMWERPCFVVKISSCNENEVSSYNGNTGLRVSRLLISRVGPRLHLLRRERARRFSGGNYFMLVRYSRFRLRRQHIQLPRSHTHWCHVKASLSGDSVAKA